VIDRDSDDVVIDRLERRVGKLLEFGVMLSSASLAVGLLAWIVNHDSRASTIPLTAGLVALMLTPLARVVASLVTWIRLRDWFFVGTTVMVFVVLIAAWLLRS
jgi:uncharacterized membrane protein